VQNTDLQIIPISDALKNRSLDVVVSGSIGAVESVRFIRSLRRLGSHVTPWLTSGGSQFVTETALTWAAANSTRVSFDGLAPHICTRDAVVISPASASIISSVANGMTNTPSLALIASALGQNIPVFFLPNMHDSLINSPAIQRNIKTIVEFGCFQLESRNAEGKQKFPEPAILADIVSHKLNAFKRTKKATTLITMGSNKGYIDDVRYVSNYSSGMLGSLISEELYRFGISTNIVAGSCPIMPKTFSNLTLTDTHENMEQASIEICNKGTDAVVMAASVLDYIPDSKFSGKLKSASEKMTVTFSPTRKIISQLNPTSGTKVGFKLEVGLSRENALLIAIDYMKKYQLSLLVINDLNDIDQSKHKALIFENTTDTPIEIDGKERLSQHIALHILKRI